MRCPTCQGKTDVIDTRDKIYGIYRRRKCPNCNRRFTTREMVQDKRINKKEKPISRKGGLGKIGVTTDTLIEANKHYNMAELAKRYHCSPSTIYYRFKTVGHKPIKHPKKR